MRKSREKKEQNDDEEARRKRALTVLVTSVVVVGLASPIAFAPILFLLLGLGDPNASTGATAFILLVAIGLPAWYLGFTAFAFKEYFRKRYSRSVKFALIGSISPAVFAVLFLGMLSYAAV